MDSQTRSKRAWKIHILRRLGWVTKAIAIDLGISYSAVRQTLAGNSYPEIKRRFEKAKLGNLRGNAFSKLEACRNSTEQLSMLERWEPPAEGQEGKGQPRIIILRNCRMCPWRTERLDSRYFGLIPVCSRGDSYPDLPYRLNRDNRVIPEYTIPAWCKLKRHKK